MLTAVLVAGRSGSAFARRSDHEGAAGGGRLEVMGFNLYGYLVAPKGPGPLRRYALPGAAFNSAPVGALMAGEIFPGHPPQGLRGGDKAGPDPWTSTGGW